MSAEARSDGRRRQPGPRTTAARGRPVRLPGAGPADRDPDEARIAQTAEEIRVLTRRAQLEHACAVGALVIDRLYDGDADAWRARGAKHATLRALAERLEALDAMSAPTLYRCLAVTELVQRLGGVSALKHASATHCYAVLPLRGEPDLQERLLRQADREGWSTRELDARVRRVRGLQPSAAVRRSVQTLADSIGRDGRELRLRLRGGEILRGRETRERVFATVMEARAALEEVHAHSYPKGGHRECPR